MFVEPGDPSFPHFRFGAFEADARLGVLTRNGRRLPLQDLPFRALLLLLERSGELVTREQMRQHLWPDTVVDFDHGLNKAINKIRDVLGDSAASPRFVETVARRGYRFLADVKTLQPTDAERMAADTGSASIDSASAEPATLTSQPPTPQPPASQPPASQPPASQPSASQPQPAMAQTAGAAPRMTHSVFAGLAVALALLLAIGGLLWGVIEAQHSSKTVRSLAVLPLENLSGDSTQDYFADGMTDELITQLAQINSLRVISRSSTMAYKNAHKPLADIARELNVQAVVEGSVVSSGSRVRITAQLIRVPADEHIWASSYEGELRDTLKLQSEVAREIANQVRGTLTPSEQAALKPDRQVDPRSYEAYLKGRYFWNKRTDADLKSAIDYFNDAIAADPSYAEAYVGLADSYALAGDWEYGLLAPQDAWPKAIAAATRALALDENLGAAHASLALAKDLFAWDWAGAETEYQRAIALSPNYATAYDWHGYHLLVMGRHREAIDELRKAERLDPLSLIIGADIADALCIAHLYDQSIEQSNKILALDPNFALAQYELGQALEQKHLHDQAIAHLQHAIELGGHSAAFDSSLAYAYARSGRKDQALLIVRDLETRDAQLPTAYPNIALAYAGLGDADSAFVWLEKAYSARVNPSLLLRPAFDSIRSDARFKSLLNRMGLPNS